MSKHRAHVRKEWDSENGAIITVIGANRIWPAAAHTAINEFLEKMDKLGIETIETEDYRHEKERVHLR